MKPTLTCLSALIAYLLLSLCADTPLACPPKGCELEERVINELFDRFKLKMVKIPGGSFKMGSERSRATRPTHEVSLKTFYMSKTEVTIEQYRACVKARACDGEINVKVSYSTSLNRMDYPATYVSWHQARDFAHWVGGELPTEAQWEYAARSAGLDRAYPWGDERPNCTYTVMNYRSYLSARSRSHKRGCGEDRVWAVCSKPKGDSAQGVCDLIGNVSEWVLDQWHPSYVGAPQDGSVWADRMPADHHVIRGGSWDDANDLQAYRRHRRRPNQQIDFIGFRVVISPPQHQASRGQSHHDLRCEQSPNCKVYGACTHAKIAGAHKCVVARDRDCQLSAICKSEGLCAEVNGRCQATQDEHCASSAQCEKKKACFAVNGQCEIGQDPACVKTWDCKQSGKCGRVNGECVADRDVYCEVSRNCEEMGHCALVNGACAASNDSHCAHSYRCKIYGQCHFSKRDQRCMKKARHDYDCLGSKLCKSSGECAAVDGWCRAVDQERCQRSYSCLSDGLCSMFEGRCQARQDQDCERSKSCKAMGSCGYVDGRCLPTREEHCKQSAVCQRDNKCSLVKNLCTSLTPQR